MDECKPLPTGRGPGEVDPSTDATFPVTWVVSKTPPTTQKPNFDVSATTGSEAPEVGPGGYCSPRHRVPVYSRVEGCCALDDAAINARRVIGCQFTPESRAAVR